MHGFPRAGFVFLCLLLVCIPLADAFEVSSFSVSPTGYLSESCGQVSGSFTVTSFSTDSGDRYLNEGEFFTSLDQPDWTLVLYSDGRETSRAEIKNKTAFLSSLNISGSGGPGFERKINVSFSSRLPYIQKTENMTVLTVRQIDSSPAGIISTEKFHYAPMVINCDCIPTACYAPRYLLEQFWDHIKENASRGVDTAAAEQKYNEAQQKITSADSRRTAEYATARSEYDAAQSAIAEGERLLDKAWAEEEIADAQEQMDKTEAIIGWFKGNQSTAYIVGLQPVLLKHQQTAKYLSMAKSEFTAGRYSLARSNATLAYTSANESYNDAVTIQYDGCGCESYFGPYVITCTEFVLFSEAAGIIIIIVLLIAGIFWWKKCKR